MYELARTGEKMNQNKHERFSTDLILKKKILHNDHMAQGRLNQDTTEVKIRILHEVFSKTFIFVVSHLLTKCTNID